MELITRIFKADAHKTNAKPVSKTLIGLGRSRVCFLLGDGQDDVHERHQKPGEHGTCWWWWWWRWWLSWRCWGGKPAWGRTLWASSEQGWMDFQKLPLKAGWLRWEDWEWVLRVAGQKFTLIRLIAIKWEPRVFTVHNSPSGDENAEQIDRERERVRSDLNWA